MSQRNPMNDRYQQENLGQTRKSAASLKPKSKAAASVRIADNKKTDKQKREAAKARRAEAAERERAFYNPPTERFHKLRRLWLICIFGAILLTIIGSFFIARADETAVYSWIFLVPAYIAIGFAMWLDMSKIRKVRIAYQEEMVKKYGAKKAAEKATEEVAAWEAEHPRWTLSSLFGGKKKADAAAAEEETTDAK